MTNKEKQEAYLDQARDEWVQDQYIERERAKEIRIATEIYETKVADAIKKSLNIK